jgi:ribosome-binding ATPase
VLHVVRCFEGGDITHVEGHVDPLRDIDTVDTELIFADLETVEKSIDKQRKLARAGDKDALLAVPIIENVIINLQKGIPVRAMNLKPDDLKLIKPLGLMTSKKVLYVANVDESDPTGKNEMVRKVREKSVKEGGGVVPVCGKLEAELAELPPEDRGGMLHDYGLTEPALATLTHEAYRLLGQQSYFTAGPKEIRAWTIPIGATAPQAAGVIHTDFEKGFIRAEIYNFRDLMELKSESAIKAAGKMRSEGKMYIMQDGDIAHFLFND